jgi:excisionase family DNA binding protein
MSALDDTTGTSAAVHARPDAAATCDGFGLPRYGSHETKRRTLVVTACFDIVPARARGSFVPVRVTPFGQASRVMARRPASASSSPPVALPMPTPLALVVVTPDDLRRLVRDELAALLREQLEPDEWITADGIARMLGYRRAYVSELARRHGLPCHQPNGPRSRLMFRRSEVEAWLQKRRGKR